jgi:hypothetical protein
MQKENEMTKTMNQSGDHEIVENPDKRTISQGNQELREEQASGKKPPAKPEKSENSTSR